LPAAAWPGITNQCGKVVVKDGNVCRRDVFCRASRRCDPQPPGILRVGRWFGWRRAHPSSSCNARVCRHHYIPMADGFVYLVAVMDWFSRRVLSWRLSLPQFAEKLTAIVGP
jgi:hypothetical protein